MKLKFFSTIFVLGLLFMCTTSFTAEARSFFSFSVGGAVAAPPVYETHVVERHYPSYVYVPGPYYGPVAAHVVPGSACRQVVVYQRPVVRQTGFSFSFFGR